MPFSMNDDKPFGPNTTYNQIIKNKKEEEKRKLEEKKKEEERRKKIEGKIKNNFSKDNLGETARANLIFDEVNIDWYNKCNRYGYIDPYHNDTISKEFLFFTKPDLNIFTDNTCATLVDGVNTDPILLEAAKRMPNVLRQLQSSVPNPDGFNNPFMFLLSNAVASKLDLPGITADSQEVTSNIMGTTIQYRGHSLKSDNGYDFSLSFKDTAYLEVYTLAKCYDEYMRLIKLGETSPKKEYIEARIIPEQFSIYKFLIGSDGETILYYAKLTGCYFTDVPRSDMGDPGNDGFKYSLSFHAQFVEDMSPYILSDFNYIMSDIRVGTDYLPVFNQKTVVSNSWAKYPKIIKADANDPIYGKRVARRGVNYDYFLKWIKE